MFSDTPLVHYARLGVAVAAIVLYLSGVYLRGGIKHVHDSRNNWRAYRCLVGGTAQADLGDCAWVSGYRDSCLEKYGRFSPPDPAPLGDFAGQFPPYPPAEYLQRSPVSALTSLIFLAVAVVAVVRQFPAFALSLAVVAAGSFSLHSTGSPAGHVLDHAGYTLAAFAAAAVSVGYACDSLGLPAWHLYFVPLVAVVAVAASFSGSSPVQDVSAVSAIALFACIFVSAIASLRPLFGLNAGVPLAVGAYLQAYPASSHELRAECTGVLGDDELYDVVHSLWHVAAAFGFLEVALFARGPSVLAFASLLFLVPGLYDPEATLTAPLMLALAAAGCALMCFFMASNLLQPAASHHAAPRKAKGKRQYSVYQYKLIA